MACFMGHFLVVYPHTLILTSYYTKQVNNIHIKCVAWPGLKDMAGPLKAAMISPYM